MGDILLSGKEKCQLYKDAERHVRRKRTKVGALLHGLERAHTLVSLLGHGNCYTASEWLEAAEQQEIWYSYDWRKQELEFMKERNLIDTRVVGSRIDVYLLNAGYVQSLRDKVLTCEDELYDANYCMVTYDIPEWARRDRDSFRRMLKSAGFTMVKASTWISSKDVKYELEEYVEELAMTDWVEICISSSVMGNSRPSKTRQS